MVMRTDAAAARRAGTARERVVNVALGLFAERGVSGTSLQMIADALGVTKAAVYHQFRSKEDIVLAVLAPALRDLQVVADAADAQPSRDAQLEVMLTGLVDLMVENRRLTAVLHADPAVARIVREHPVLRALGERVDRHLVGPDPDAETLVGVAMVTGGLMVCGVDPLLADLDGDILRRHLLDAARRVLRIRPEPSSGQPRGAVADPA